MKKGILLLLALCAFYLHTVAQVKQYVLMNKAMHSDFNYPALAALDTATQPKAAFKPVAGSYSVYTFVANYTGTAASGAQKEFNDLLIVKTDNRLMIVDAYQYTLEWAEPPFTSDLYRASAKGMILKNKLSLAALKFVSVNSKDRDLNEEGILILR